MKAEQCMQAEPFLFMIAFLKTIMQPEPAELFLLRFSIAAFILQDSPIMLQNGTAERFLKVLW